MDHPASFADPAIPLPSMQRETFDFFLPEAAWKRNNY
jgi:hypothetical protein